MAKKRKVIKVMWIVIALIAIASIASLIIFPKGKAVFLAGSGGFLILNLLISMFFIHHNFKE